MQINKKPLARHRIVDFYGCNPNVLSFSKYLEPVMQQAATLAGCAIVGMKGHQFNPVGATVFVLVAESHLSIHTWPERSQALVDIFASGDIDMEIATKHIGEAIGATSSRITDIQRG